MREAQQAGTVRSIGVSNYGVHHLDELEAYIGSVDAERGPGAGGRIDVGQYELHPWLMRRDVVAWLRGRGAVVQAFSPLVRGERWGDEGLARLAARYGKTEAQVLLRWSLQRGFVPLPKSVTEARIEQNAAVFGWALEDADAASLDTDEYAPCTWDPTTSRD
jgi:diketogulonate reductase-like aldo/keto reductase